MTQRISYFFPPVVSGAMLGALFYAPALWPLVFIALAPLFFFLQERAKTRREIVVGIFVALSMMDAIILAAFKPTPAFLSYFLNDLLRLAPAWAKAPLVIYVSLLILWLLFSILLALPHAFIAGGGYAALKMRRARAVVSPGIDFFILPGLWVLAEYARAFLSTGFTFGHIGYRVIDFLPLALTSRLWGVYGLGFLIACVNQAAVYLLSRKDRVRAILILAALFLLVAIGFIVAAAEHRDGWKGKPLRVAVLQGGISRNAGDDNRQALRTLLPESYSSLIARIADGKDVVLLPEGISNETISARAPGSFQRAEDFFSNIAKTKRFRTLIVGHDVIDSNTLRTYNALIAWEADAMRDMYRKRVLFVFGEYFPVLETLFPQVFPPVISYLPGSQKDGLIQTSAGAFGTVICQEINLPGLVRRDVKAGATLLLSGGSEWQFGKYVQEEELRIARMRALETRRYFLRAMKAGTSAIIDPFGRVVKRPAYSEEVLYLDGEAAALGGLTPYVRYGDAPILLLAGAFLVLPFRKLVRKLVF